MRGGRLVVGGVVKRLLQVALPRPVRSRIAARLFARFVSVDETAFAEELYLSLDQLRLMWRCGMEVGGHGDAHDRLGSLTADEQRRRVRPQPGPAARGRRARTTAGRSPTPTATGAPARWTC